VCFDGLYLDESDVSVLINADAKWVAADATDMTRPEWRIT
jgi:putative N-acetylmannosamine-6-phosphate epimerase